MHFRRISRVLKTLDPSSSSSIGTMINSSTPGIAGAETVGVTKILMLHGLTQSGSLFHSKTKALEKHLQKSLRSLHVVHLVYPTAPHRLAFDEIPQNTHPRSDQGEVEAYAWWRKDITSFRGMDETWALLSGILDTDGPFAGVIGFSQGAALAAMLTSALESGRSSRPAGLSTKHPPMRFCVAYSGFRSHHDGQAELYEPKISTPILHVVGRNDTVVVESRSMALVKACEEEEVLWHEGGHYVVVQKPFLDGVTDFIARCLKDKQEN